ncbi:MAG: SH3 domain-containing protein [Actinobacteria bacterium]|nr:SH3 domain-containing protein [Actinomycetota bacterium]
MRTRRHPANPVDGKTAHRVGGEGGWAEFVVLFLFAAVIGAAFVWALVLHEKPPDTGSTSATTFDPTATTLVPPTLPAPRKYAVEDTGVNLREGPATNTKVLTRLEGGTKVRVICKTVGQDVTGEDGSTNLWLRIDLGQFGLGYASALYVDVGDDLEDNNAIGDCVLAPVG